MAASNYSGARTYSTAFPILNFQGTDTLSNGSGSFANPTILPYATTQTGILTVKDLIKQSGYTTSTSGASGNIGYGNRFDNTHPFVDGTTRIHCNFWKPTFNNTASFNTTSINGTSFGLGQTYTGGGAMTISDATTVEINSPDAFTTLAPSIYFALKTKDSTGAQSYAVDSKANFIPGPGSALATNATNGFFALRTCAGTPTGTPSIATPYSVAPVVIDTTNNQLFYYNPITSAWMCPGRCLLSKTVTSGSASSIAFSSIPQGYNHLQVILVGQATAAGDTTVQVNGIATNTYDGAVVYENASGAPGAGISPAQTGYQVGPLPGSVTPGLVMLDFPFYSQALWNKCVRITNGWNNTVTNRVTMGVGNNRATTVITSLTIFSGGGNFVDNTTAYLYAYI